MKSLSLKRTVVALAGVGALAAVIALLVGVHGGGESAATAKQNFCNSLSSLSSTVTKFEGLNRRTTSNDQIEHAAKNINDAWSKVGGAARNWARTSGNAT